MLTKVVGEDSVSAPHRSSIPAVHVGTGLAPGGRSPQWQQPLALTREPPAGLALYAFGFNKRRTGNHDHVPGPTRANPGQPIRNRPVISED